MPSFRQGQPLDWAAPGEAGLCAAAARGDAAGRDGPGIIFISLFPGEKKNNKKTKAVAREPPAGADGAAVTGRAGAARGPGRAAGPAGLGRAGGGWEDEAAERGLQQTAAAAQAEPHHRGHLRQVPSGRRDGGEGGGGRAAPVPSHPRLLSGSRRPASPAPVSGAVRAMAPRLPQALPRPAACAPPLGRSGPAADPRARLRGGERGVRGGAAGQGPVGAAGRKRRGAGGSVPRASHPAAEPWFPGEVSSQLGFP